MIFEVTLFSKSLVPFVNNNNETTKLKYVLNNLTPQIATHQKSTGY